MGFITQIHSFASGELSPWLDGRSDIDKYGAGCRTMLNVIPLPQGGFQRRPGMEYLGKVQLGAIAGRLVEFQISTTEASMLVVGGGKLAVWNSNGLPALKLGTPISLTVPWTDADLPLLRWKQINSVCYFVHPNHAPRKLTRYDADDWEIVEVDFSKTPALLPENFNEEHTIETVFVVGGTPPNWSGAGVSYAAGARVMSGGKAWVCMKQHNSSAPKQPGLASATYLENIIVSGRITQQVTKPLWVEGFADTSAVIGQVIDLKATFDTWKAGHVGSVFEIAKKRGSKDYETKIEAKPTFDGKYSSTIVVQGTWSFDTFGTWKGTFTIERSDDRGATWEEVRAYEGDGERNVSDSGEEKKRVLMRVKWTHATNGSSDPRGVLSANDAYIRGLVRITAVSDARLATAEVISPIEKAITYNWSEGAWSSAQGFPRVIELHQARVVMGATTLKPHTVWGSAVDDYENFYPGLAADEAYRHTVAIGERDPILWLVSERFLLIGTGSGEWIMHGEDEEKAIISEYGVAKRHSSYGSHNGGVPACFADSVSLFVQRGGTRVREFSYRFEADRYEAANLNLLADHLFTSPVEDIAVQRMPWQIVWFVSAGKLYGLTYERSQNVAAWHRHETTGSILSVGSIRATGTEDQVWFLVNRGPGQLLIERFRQGHMDARPDDGWWHDSAVAVPFPYDFTAAGHLIGWSITGYANRQGFGPLDYPGGPSWQFITGHVMGFALLPPGSGELIVERLWKDAGRRNGKPWFEVVGDPSSFMQWTTHLETPRWQIFRDGLVVLESEDDTAQPHLAGSWSVTEEGLALGIDRPEFSNSPLLLPPNAWGPIRITGLSLFQLGAVDLMPTEPGSYWGLYYQGASADYSPRLFYTGASGGSWRMFIDTIGGTPVAEFRSDSDFENPFQATGWYRKGATNGLPVVVTSPTPGAAYRITGVTVPGISTVDVSGGGPPYTGTIGAYTVNLFSWGSRWWVDVLNTAGLTRVARFRSSAAGAANPLLAVGWAAEAVVVNTSATPGAAFRISGISTPNVDGVDVIGASSPYTGTMGDFTVVLYSASSRWWVDVFLTTGMVLVARFQSSAAGAGNPLDATVWEDVNGLPSLLSALPGTNTAIVGLPFRYVVSPMTPDVPLANGPSRSREARVMRIALSLKDSRGGEIGESLDKQLDPIGKGDASSTFTGEHEQAFEGGHSPEVPILITGAEPFPFALRSLYLKMNAFGDAH